MNHQIILFVATFLCGGAVVTVYILWLAGLFSDRAKPQSVYDEIVRDAIVLGKAEKWLEEEIYDGAQVKEAKDNNDECVTSDNTDDIIYGRHECAESLKNMINKWRSEL